MRSKRLARAAVGVERRRATQRHESEGHEDLEEIDELSFFEDRIDGERRISDGRRPPIGPTSQTGEDYRLGIRLNPT